MKTRGWKIEDRGWRARSVLERGNPLPLLSPTDLVRSTESALGQSDEVQATADLVAIGSVWTEIPPPYATNTTSLYFIEPLPAGNKFYRLHKP